MKVRKRGRERRGKRKEGKEEGRKEKREKARVRGKDCSKFIEVASGESSLCMWLGRK